MLVICEPISTGGTDRLKAERDVSNVNGRQDTHGAGQGGNPHGDDSERGTGAAGKRPHIANVQRP